MDCSLVGGHMLVSSRINRYYWLPVTSLLSVQSYIALRLLEDDRLHIFISKYVSVLQGLFTNCPSIKLFFEPKVAKKCQKDPKFG